MGFAVLMSASLMRPPDHAGPREEAHLEVFWVPFDDLLSAVVAGRVREGPGVIAVLTYAVTRGYRVGSRS